MKDPFDNVKIIWELYDGVNFFPRRESKEIQKVVERYIKKPKIYRLSTDKN